MNPDLSAEISDAEFEAFSNRILTCPEYFDMAQVAARYRSCGLRVVQNAHDPEIPRLICKALNEKRGYSAIRIGDGEGNILGYAEHPDTLNLEQSAARTWLATRADRFDADETGLRRLKQLLLETIDAADIVGVRGLWSANPIVRSPDTTVARLRQDPRGMTGVWNAIDRMLGLASLGALHGKTIGSAHFYLAVLKNLDALVEAADRVLLVSSDEELSKAFEEKYPDKRIDYIQVGRGQSQQSESGEPDFLPGVASLLPEDMTGSLALVGAGIWANMYCTWIKRLGGAAVDIGSGVDLLMGRESRPMHRFLDTSDLRSLRLISD